MREDSGGEASSDNVAIPVMGQIAAGVPIEEYPRTHHRRDRVAGETEKDGIADPPEGQRPPGLHRDLPEVHFSRRFQGFLHEIRFADGNSTGGDDGLAFSRRDSGKSG